MGGGGGGRGGVLGEGGEVLNSDMGGRKLCCISQVNNYLVLEGPQRQDDLDGQKSVSDQAQS